MILTILKTTFFSNPLDRNANISTEMENVKPLSSRMEEMRGPTTFDMFIHFN